MLGLKQLLFSITVGSFLLFTASCAEEPSTDVDASDVVEVGSDNSEIKDEVHHQIPTPHEMIEFIHAYGGEFKPELLCDLDISERYVDLKGKSMGMGIYIADLAYSASYSKFQESMNYFNVIVKMAEDVGISGVFDEQMLTRIQNNLNNTDSLEAISNQSYYKIIADLEANDRGKVVAMIAAGGFLESLFISTQLVTKFKADDPMMERIAGQKLIYENIMAYLEKYKDDQNVEWTITDMTALKASFDDVSDTRMDTKFSEGKGGKKILGGKGGVYITEQEFEELRYHAAFLRNSITFNPPVNQ